jgi:hypothetical protein
MCISEVWGHLNPALLDKNNCKNDDIPVNYHPHAGEDPVILAISWIPAFAGITEAMIITSNY